MIVHDENLYTEMERRESIKEHNTCKEKELKGSAAQKKRVASLQINALQPPTCAICEGDRLESHRIHRRFKH